MTGLTLLAAGLTGTVDGVGVAATGTGGSGGFATAGFVGNIVSTVCTTSATSWLTGETSERSKFRLSNVLRTSRSSRLSTESLMRVFDDFGTAAKPCHLSILHPSWDLWFELLCIQIFI